MHKKSVIIGLLSALFAACTVSEPATSPGALPVVLTALQEGAPDTRTVVAAQTQIHWEPGDAVKLFFDGSGSRFTAMLDEPAPIARFSGTLDVLIGFNEGFPAERPLWGLYPWRDDATADNGSVTTTLPAVQTGRAGSFAPDTYITLGRSDNLTMGFWGVCGGVRFSLTQEGIKQVRLESLGGEALAGRITIGFEDGVPVVREVREPESVLILNAPDGGTFQPGEWYYIVALPGPLEKGFRLTFRKGSRTAEMVRESPVTLKRSIFGSLEEADKDLEFKIPGIGDPDDPIRFADPSIKARLVAAFDTDGDGEISYNEADAVTSLGTVFQEQTDYVSFDEFRFFTSVTEVPALMCRSWTSLESIQLPESLTSIGIHAFYGCSKLEEITIPEAVRKIERYAFYGCSSLSRITLPESLESIGDWCFCEACFTEFPIPPTVRAIGSCAFRNCRKLRSVTLPPELTELSGSVFFGCQALEEADLPASLTRIGVNAFYGCASLKDIRLPETLEKLESSTFYGCSALNSVQLPGTLGEIGSSAFEGCSGLMEITIPAGVTAIGESAFRSCSGLQIIRVLPSLPPSGGSQMFAGTNNCPIYVPGATAALYSEAPYWSDYVSRMRSDDGSSIFYTSTDYSRDGEVVQLQAATVGRGVNFILLGDGFVDKDMETGGKYEQRMRSAMEALFKYEPYRSQRQRFNVYTVKIVSANAQYNSNLSNRRLTYDTDGAINFRSSICTEYGNKVPNPNGQPLKMAALCNSDTRVGRSYCIRNSTGWACCIVYDPNTDVLVHELCGHGFGDLADEYSESSETFTDQAGLDREWNNYGWGANVDWRSDPTTVRWARFLSDSRYAGEGLGVYEGGKTYSKGIYRPSYNSMMRYNNCPFNAPSREQIYKNIMRWSVGSGWLYDYETFVSLDEAGRGQAAGQLRSASLSASEETKLSTQHAMYHVPPVLVDEDVTETSIPLEGRPVVKILKRSR
ncbi:MAG: leucine-rich repeat protein [Bacteroidales bacterium]|nr:leucine-rich repeat protein [Bacteroidales bacterium]